MNEADDRQPVDITLEQAKEKLASGALLLDVRNEDEWQAGHIPGALFRPLPTIKADPASAAAELRSRMSGTAPVVTPEEKPGLEGGRGGSPREVVVVCRSGQRSRTAAEILRHHGVLAYNLEGGMKAWAAAGLDMVSESGDDPSVI